MADVRDDQQGSVPGSVFRNVGPVVPMVTMAPRAEPSWPRVLATTIELWVARQRHAAGGFLARLTVRRWRVAAVLLALAIVATAVPVFSGVFTGTAAPAAARPSPGGARAHGIAPPATATAAAAAWITGQVTSNAIVGCYPAMCAALQAHGVLAGLLLRLDPGSAGPPAADVIVTSASAGSRLAAEYAPAVIASFGSGSARIEVRVIARDGRASYESASRADLAARLSAGSQLLQNYRIHFSTQAAAEVRLGEVDSRLLATLAALSSQYSFQVTAFDDASPGARTLFREMIITKSGRHGSAQLAGVRAAADAQDAPYLPDHAVMVRPAGGRTALRVEFAAPSPLGLLTTVLADDTRRA